jgi:hypothetical protein
MSVDRLGMFESLAEHGTAPDDGCSLFGVGYESAFTRLQVTYIDDRFRRGGSAEKFVVGPFGSGKTHFLRQLMEVGRKNDCVTAEIKLNKNLDYSQGLVVFQEIARQLRCPGKDVHGLRSVILDAVDRLRRNAEEAGLPAEEIIKSWVSGLTEQDFPQPAFGRVLQKSLRALAVEDMGVFDLGVRWLSGEVTDRGIAKVLMESPVASSEIRIHAHNSRLALYKFIKYAGYRGTIVCFDEAEQGIAVERKKMIKIFSSLLAEINAIVDLKDGAVMIVYAITPDVMTKINTDMPMIQSRLKDPGPDNGFFSGNTLAPTIDLTLRPSPVDELRHIGERLVELFFDEVPDADQARRTSTYESVQGLAEEVDRLDAAASARREMVRRVCVPLVNSCRVGGGSSPRPSRPLEAEV